MNTRILSIIIVYNPDLDLLLKNIKSFVQDIDLLLIWENTTLSDEQKRTISQISPSKIIYHNEMQNKGISYPLNYAWKYAQQHDFNFLLTMDQDSIWENFNLYINNCLKRVSYEQAIFGPSLDININQQLFIPKKYVITSGCFIPISILNKIGGYETNFFVDGIDIELCHRARTFGYNTYKVNHCRLIQRFGNPQVINILGFKYTTLNYSAQRLYNILYSHFIIIRKYKDTFLLKQVLTLYILKTPIKIILGEKNKWDKLKAIYKGLSKGLKNSHKSNIMTT